jgi:hypothetical protein
VDWRDVAAFISAHLFVCRYLSFDGLTGK